MRLAHTVAQVRAAEAAAMRELPEGVLMQRAAAGLAHAVLDFLGSGYGRRVLLLVGSGDNGGDALYAAALLRRRGVTVDALLLGSSHHEAGLAALLAAGGRLVSSVEGLAPDVVVDAIVGIGGRPGLRPDAAAALAALEGIRMPSLVARAVADAGVDATVLIGAGSTFIAGATITAATAGTGIAVAGSGDDDASDTAITGSDLEKASDAALAHTGEGKVSETEVGDEESYYEVEVTLENGNQVDVQLDEGFAVVDTIADSETDQ